MNMTMGYPSWNSATPKTNETAKTQLNMHYKVQNKISRLIGNICLANGKMQKFRLHYFIKQIPTRPGGCPISKLARNDREGSIYGRCPRNSSGHPMEGVPLFYSKEVVGAQNHVSTNSV